MAKRPFHTLFDVTGTQEGRKSLRTIISSAISKMPPNTRNDIAIVLGKEPERKVIMWVRFWLGSYRRPDLFYHNVVVKHRQVMAEDVDATIDAMVFIGKQLEKIYENRPYWLMTALVHSLQDAHTQTEYED